MTWRDAVSWLPRKVHHQFRTRGGDTRFLIWISFLITFLWARITLTYVPAAPNVGVPGQVEVGGRLVFFGYHPHHIANGVLFLAIAGWIGLHYQGRTVTRIAGVLYGVGLGLIVDEAGFIIEGFTYGNDFPEVFIIVVTVGGLLMSTVYAPSFWASFHAGMRRVWMRGMEAYRRWRGREAPLAPEEPPGPQDPSKP